MKQKEKRIDGGFFHFWYLETLGRIISAGINRVVNIVSGCFRGH
jgi:hypothetical protein